MNNWLKDTTRRMKEGILQAVGAVDRTEDPEFDAKIQNFLLFGQATQRVFESFQTYLDTINSLCAAGVALGESLSSFYNDPSSPAEEIARYYLHASRDINEQIRSSVQGTFVDRVIRPAGNILSVVPEIVEKLDKRKQLVVEFDSCRSRLQAEPPQSVNYQKVSQKLEQATANLNQSTQEIRTQLDILDAQKSHMLIAEFSALLGCQVQFFDKTHEILEQLVPCLPHSVATLCMLNFYADQSKKRATMSLYQDFAVKNSIPSIQSVLPMSLPPSLQVAMNSGIHTHSNLVSNNNGSQTQAKSQYQNSSIQAKPIIKVTNNPPRAPQLRVPKFDPQTDFGDSSTLERLSAHEHPLGAPPVRTLSIASRRSAALLNVSLTEEAEEGDDEDDERSHEEHTTAGSGTGASLTQSPGMPPAIKAAPPKPPWKPELATMTQQQHRGSAGEVATTTSPTGTSDPVTDDSSSTAVEKPRSASGSVDSSDHADDNASAIVVVKEKPPSPPRIPQPAANPSDKPTAKVVVYDKPPAPVKLPAKFPAANRPVTVSLPSNVISIAASTKLSKNATDSSELAKDTSFGDHPLKTQSVDGADPTRLPFKLPSPPQSSPIASSASSSIIRTSIVSVNSKPMQTMSPLPTGASYSFPRPLQLQVADAKTPANNATTSATSSSTNKSPDRKSSGMVMTSDSFKGSQNKPPPMFAGLSPKEGTPPPPAKMVPQPIAPIFKKQNIVEAVYPFSSSDNGDLSLVVGERVEVLDVLDEAGWWRGKNIAGREGIFPSNYVKRI